MSTNATEADFSYAAGYTGWPQVSFARTGTATEVSEQSDQAFAYWPGALHASTTITRVGTATYVNEATAP